MDALSPILLKRIQRLERQQQDRRTSMVVPRRKYPLPTGGGGTSTLWAKIQAGGVGTDRLTAVKLLDAAGEEIGDPFVVRVLGSTATGLTSTPTLAQCEPILVAGAIIPIDLRASACILPATTYPAGYWLSGIVNFTSVCP